MNIKERAAATATKLAPNIHNYTGETMAPTEVQKTEHDQKGLFAESTLTREILDSANEERNVIQSTPGVTEEVVRLISSDKKKPQ